MMVEADGTVGVPVGVVSEMPSLTGSSVAFAAVDALHGSVEGLGLAHVREGDGALRAEPLFVGGLRAGWYLVLRSAPSQAAGLQRFAKGVVAIDGAGVVVVQVGEVADADRLVEVWSRPMPQYGLLRVGVEDTVTDGDTMKSAIEARLTTLGLAAEVQSITTTGLEWQRPFGPAPLADVTLGLANEGATHWVIRPNPAAFEVETKRSGVTLKAPSLLEQALRFPVETDNGGLIDALCGLVALGNPHEVLGPFLVERAVDAGLTLMGDEEAARWRLAELYALAGLRHLALEFVGERSLGSSGALANASRHRAGVLHFSETMGMTAAPDAVIANLSQAKSGYYGLGFDLGAAAVMVQEAEVYFASQREDLGVARVEEALELLLRADQFQWAGDLYVELALGPHRDARATARQEWLKAAEDAYIRGGEQAGAQWTNAVIGATSDDVDEVVVRLQEAGVAGAQTPEDEVFVILCEANLEARSGRSRQALTTYAEGLERAWALDMPTGALVALERAVSLLERSTYDRSTLPLGGQRLLALTSPPAATRMTAAQRAELAHWTRALCAYEMETLQRCQQL